MTSTTEDIQLTELWSKTCVIIPTFNNSGTLATVIEDVLRFTNNIIVVNDGSTDETAAVMDIFPTIGYVHYKPNRGKGWALRRGFAHASALGFQYAITIDSDGQHFAKDIPIFLEKLKETGDAIIIGARNMDQAGIPGKSSFGHRFSNFWFKLETGIAAPDTQSGFRLYPIHLLSGMHFFTRKYEFEIEVIVRAAWKGIAVESVPVSVYYPPKEERVSHFRPFKDFSRISVLNTILVLITFFYIWPRNFFRTIFNRNKWSELWHVHLLGDQQPDYIKAWSVAVGICFGILPIWGFQMLSAMFIAFIFRLNKVLVLLAANISAPPLIPFIILLSLKVGAPVVGGNAMQINFSHRITLSEAKQHLLQYLVGATLLAIIAGAVIGLVVYLLLKTFRTKKITAA